MSWSKKVIVNYHFINAAYENYFNELNMSFDALLKNEDSSGTFDAGQSHFFWNINSKVNIADTDTYFISVVKEKCAWPVWFKENDGIAEIPLSDGALGELYYAIVNPKGRFILSLAAAGGGPTGAFNKFLNEFSKDGSVELTPLFEDKIELTALSWDFIKKIAVSFKFPTYEHQAEFMASMAGTLFGLLDEVDGLSVNITVAAPKAKQQLNAAQTKRVAKTLLANEFCNKLVLKGANFDDEEMQEFDLKNAQVKYKEMVEISGSYMVEDEALPILKRAYNDRSHDIIKGYSYDS